MNTEEKYTDNFRKLLQETKHYLNLQKEYALMDTADKLTVILSTVAISAICFVLCAMILFFLTFALAYWIGNLTGNLSLGFISISALLAIILLIAFKKRNAWVVQPLARMMVRLFVTKEETNNEQS
ncbi:MAG: phage holin family protein [Bacteroidaceae bacterium]|nr:phage holin family protein [Bacteroidaceae bacterium]MBR2945904.1 phage holin family protein [Bacteroidaceae bacterium]MDO5489317.1 phage holin family protein [Bacteroidaceae bacterium]